MSSWYLRVGGQGSQMDRVGGGSGGQGACSFASILGGQFQDNRQNFQLCGGKSEGSRPCVLMPSGVAFRSRCR